MYLIKEKKQGNTHNLITNINIDYSKQRGTKLTGN